MKTPLVPRGHNYSGIIHALAAFAFTGNAFAATIISDASIDYPKLTAKASGGASAEDFTSTDANVSSLTAASTDSRIPLPPRTNSAFAGINRQLGEFGVQSNHTLTLKAELNNGGVNSSVSDQFLIQTDVAVLFSFQAIIQASLAGSSGLGRQATFTISNEASGEIIYHYNWHYAPPIIILTPTLTPSFSTVLEPGTYKFDAHLSDTISGFVQSATTTSFDYSFSISVPEPSSVGMLGCAALCLLTVRPKRRQECQARGSGVARSS
jgi:hypothetical protein